MLICIEIDCLLQLEDHTWKRPKQTSQSVVTPSKKSKLTPSKTIQKATNPHHKTNAEALQAFKQQNVYDSGILWLWFHQTSYWKCRYSSMINFFPVLLPNPKQNTTSGFCPQTNTPPSPTPDRTSPQCSSARYTRCWAPPSEARPAQPGAAEPKAAGWAGFVCS